ncbi:MAG: prepilin-type N-terminal cleavage/methylation domain-containing protein [Planctomycetes bacterium]|nr:prepilin-type N-terminal cleavage/methylation domain-containing protein [Planctomycetota bacterium]
MRQKRFLYRRSGFTLIEMIGVIAIIAILAAFITPKIFQVIQDSKVTRFAGEVNTYKAAVTKWYKDIGALRSLNAGGVALATDTSFQNELIANQGTTAISGLWAQWNGPYIDSVSNKSLGTTLTIRTQAGNTGTGAPATNNGNAFDLDDDGVNDMAGQQVVALMLTGVTLGDFTKMNNMIDTGLAAATATTSGKVKYGGTTMFVYLTSL